MASKKVGTSFGFATEVEEIPIETIEDYEDEVDHSRSGLQRSLTDAQLPESRPQHRVQFHTLPAGRRFSHDGFELLSVKAHEVGLANWSGGWQNTVLRRRRKGIKPLSEEEEVQEIAQAMEEDQKLMADDVDGEVLRREALRELTKSLKVKKEIKKRLSVSRFTLKRSSHKNISYYKSFKYSLSMKWFQFKERVKEALHDNSLWHKDIKVIEGMNGSSVGSYFRFLRYLFLLNFFVSLIM